MLVDGIADERITPVINGGRMKSGTKAKNIRRRDEETSRDGTSNNVVVQCRNWYNQRKTFFFAYN